MKRSIDELNPEGQAAINAFAAKYGRKWKQRLAEAWGTGADTQEPLGWALRSIRNTPSFGHDWLDKI